MLKATAARAPRRPWAWCDEEMLRRNYATALTADLAAALGRPVGQVHAKACALGLRKAPELLAEMARQATAAPGHGSHSSRFTPGQPAWNKGVKGSTGHHPASRASQFRPGNKPHTWQPIGTLRVVGGQLQRKVNDLPGPNWVRWHPVTRLVWEAAHGPVPAGHVVVFRPGRKTTDEAAITLDALELLSRGELMRRQSVHALYPPELGRLVLLRGALQRQIKRRQAQANDTPTEPAPEIPAP